ncbi:MAG: Ig-like domain-containing protein [Bacteroidales bacterium]|nr:Ig-like domain-containing protein [Bacteroidales bacterium]
MMKVNRISAFLLAITLCGCSRDTDRNWLGLKPNVSLTLSAEMPSGEEETKTIFSSNKNIWSESDNIGVAIGENGKLKQFDLIEGSGTTKGVFSGKVNPFSDSKIYAVYPYSEVEDIHYLSLSMEDRTYKGNYQLSGNFSDYSKYSFLVGCSDEYYSVAEGGDINAPTIQMDYVSSMAYFRIVSNSEKTITIDSIELLCEGNEENKVYTDAVTLDLTELSGDYLNPVRFSDHQLVNISPDTPLTLKNGDEKYVKMMMFPVNYEDGANVIIRLYGRIGSTPAVFSTAKTLNSTSSIGSGQIRGFHIPLSVVSATDFQTAESAFNSGATNVTVSRTVYENEAIVVPTVGQNSSSSISLNAYIVKGGTLTVNNTNETPIIILNNTYSGGQTIAGNAVLDLPKSTAYVSGKYNSVVSNIVDNPLIIEKSASIDSLAVNSGDVFIHGSVNGLYTDENYNGRILIENEYGDMMDIITVQEISLTQTDYVKYVGDEFQITYRTNPYDATFPLCAFSSSNSQVASVENGRVRCNMLGTAVIMASAGSKRAYITVNVVPTPVGNIYLNLTEYTMRVGESVIITATVEPYNATDKTINWTSSDPSVASVNDGQVIAHGLGTTTITAEAGGLTATCQIAVLPTPVTGISLDRHDTSILLGDSMTLNATIYPEDATNKNVIWSTSDENTATVENGVVTGIRPGYVTIYATTEDGSYVDWCNLYVVDTAIHVDWISVDIEGSTCLSPGESVRFIAYVYPENATNPNIIWTSSDENVASVDNGIVTAKKVGSTVITATAEDGGHTWSTEVTVAIRVQKIRLDITEATINLGETLTLTATILPENATNKNVNWWSGNEEIATVEGGVVTGIKRGDAWIYAYSEDSGHQANCYVRVVDPNIIEFRDWHFREFMLENYDADGDGEISKDEAKSVTEIDYSYDYLDFWDLQHFTNLKKLSIRSTVDGWYTANNIGALSYLTQLTHLELFNWGLQEGHFDISAMVNLEHLELIDCYLDELNVSNNTKLSYLDCSPSKYDSLRLLVIHQGQIIPNVTVSRNSDYIPDYTKIFIEGSVDAGGNEGTREGDEI